MSVFSPSILQGADTDRETTRDMSAQVGIKFLMSQMPVVVPINVHPTFESIAIRHIFSRKPSYLCHEIGAGLDRWKISTILRVMINKSY